MVPRRPILNSTTFLFGPPQQFYDSAEITFQSLIMKLNAAGVVRRIMLKINNLQRWWRRRESNPRPKMLSVKSLHT